jgi:hypothetical protein
METTATATRNIAATTPTDCSRTVDGVVGCLSRRRVLHSSDLRVEDVGKAADGSTGWPHSDPPGRRLTAALAVPREVAKELQSLAMAMAGLSYRAIPGLPEPPSRAADVSQGSPLEGQGRNKGLEPGMKMRKWMRLSPAAPIVLPLSGADARVGYRRTACRAPISSYSVPREPSLTLGCG